MSSEVGALRRSEVHVVESCGEKREPAIVGRDSSMESGSRGSISALSVLLMKNSSKTLESHAIFLTPRLDLVTRHYIENLTNWSIVAYTFFFNLHSY